MNDEPMETCLITGGRMPASEARKIELESLSERKKYTDWAVEGTRRLQAKHIALWTEDPSTMPPWLRTPLPRLYIHFVEYEQCWQGCVYYPNRAGWQPFRGPEFDMLYHLVTWMETVFPGLPIHVGVAKEA